MKSAPLPAGPTAGLDVIWFKQPPPAIAEYQFSYEFCRKTSRKLCGRELAPASWTEVEIDRPLGRVLARLAGDRVLLVFHPEAVLAPAAIEHLLASLADHEAVVPVFNGAPSPGQAAVLPAAYLNLATYLEVAALVAARQPPAAEELADPDLSCVLLPRELLASLWEPELAGEQLYERLAGRRIMVDRGALIHVFGNSYSAERLDLAELVPAAARRVLDVGCARGGFGALLRRLRPDVELIGVEMNAVMAADAAPHYDRLVTSRVEDADFSRCFDHINCGDVIEHLDDPWRMLRVFRDLLVPDGTLVISLPNAGHWTIVRDLARGEFLYLPLGLQCITHLRWFTETSIKEALEEAGFTVDVFRREQLPPTPSGERFIDDLCRLGHGERTSLLTNQITLRAVRGQS
ncbi:MAG: class I SAM-dependent methyltransferase [Deltaproteobacteria bacterium]|nr:class I SAM-dependent methyltransferase [Deltaproteobacteria bacterium]